MQENNKNKLKEDLNLESNENNFTPKSNSKIIFGVAFGILLLVSLIGGIVYILNSKIIKIIIVKKFKITKLIMKN